MRSVQPFNPPAFIFAGRVKGPTHFPLLPLEDTGSATAIEVTIGVGVLVTKVGRHGEHIVCGHPLAIIRERKLVERDSGRGDECLGRGDERLVSDLFRDSQASGDKLLVEVERVSGDGRHCPQRGDALSESWR